MSQIFPQNKQQIVQNVVQSDLTFVNQKQQLKQQEEKQPLTKQMDILWNDINKVNQIEQFCTLVKEYCVMMVGSQDQEIFMTYFIENKFLTILSHKIKEFKQGGELLRTTFSLLQFLLKALKKQEQLVYFLVKINQQKFVSQEYTFKQQEDMAYYANFLKLMVRKINEDQKYLSVFLNSKEPHFPLLLQLLKMYNCKDQIMHTSSKLALLELSNSPSPILQSYLSNFPFVLFYPLLVGQIGEKLCKLLSEDDEQSVQQLQNSIRYMQEFVENKDRFVIDMYTNSFLRIVGRFLYSQIIQITDKKIKNVVKLMKILLQYVIPEVNVVKIRTSLLCLFCPCIHSKMRKCFQSKKLELQTKYWLPQTCSEEVVSHCKAIFFTEKQTKSFIKSINSYIPRSKDNWLFHEIKTISQIIGFKVELQQHINTDHYDQGSFLQALWAMIDDEPLRNQVFSCIYKSKNQELLFYYIRVLIELCDPSELEGKLQFQHLVQEMTSCTSLSLVQSFYNLVTKSKQKCEQNDFINRIYQNITEKLIYFVLTKGWKELLLRIKDSRSQDYDKSFSNDIYRQVQCDILLFVALRTLLGTTNHSCQPINSEKWANYPKTCETTFKCREGGSKGPLLYAILDGQHLNFRDTNQKIVNKSELLMSDLQFFEEGDKIGIMSGNKSNFYISVQIEQDMRQYFMKEMSQRREMSQRISMELRLMKFQFQYL